MDLGDFKLYGLCIMRLNHQISRAKEHGRMCGGRAVLESYCTGDVEDIVDLLELYDLAPRTTEALQSKLAELAADASLFVREPLAFDYNAEGELCIYLMAQATTDVPEDAPAWEMPRTSDKTADKDKVAA